MQTRTVTVAELALVAGTRVALGAGLALLTADRLDPGARRGAGWALLGAGALSTIPLALELLGRPAAPRRETA